MRRFLPLLVVAFLGLATVGTTACADVLDQKSCTTLACGDEGVSIDFTLRERGTYDIAVVVDGARTSCRATLPLRSDDPGCGQSPAVLLTRTGSALPEGQQSIGPLRIASTSAREISVRVERNGALVAEKTFAPAYQTTPGPNGPDCDPASCTRAGTTLP